MFVLAVLDSTDQRKNIQKRLSVVSGLHLDFALSDEDLSELCLQTEPDVLIFAAHYEDVSAKFLVHHLQGESQTALPERILIVSETPETEERFKFPSSVQGWWIRENQLPAALTEDLSLSEPEETASLLRILHISDDRLLQKVISDLIHKQTRYVLETASNGNQGLDIYQSFHPNLVLTDWDLPDIDGIEICRRIKMDFNDSKTCVAIFSSFTDEHLIEEAYKVHAKAYIVKPVAPDLFIQKIRKLLEPKAS